MEDCACVVGDDEITGLCGRHSRWLRRQVAEEVAKPIPMRLPCPECHALHIDEGDFAAKPHHTHACQECGAIWRPALVFTTGVRFLPGCKNESK